MNGSHDLAAKLKKLEQAKLPKGTHIDLGEVRKGFVATATYMGGCRWRVKLEKAS